MALIGGGGGGHCLKFLRFFNPNPICHGRAHSAWIEFFLRGALFLCVGSMPLNILTFLKHQRKFFWGGELKKLQHGCGRWAPAPCLLFWCPGVPVFWCPSVPVSRCPIFGTDRHTDRQIHRGSYRGGAHLKI